MSAADHSKLPKTPPRRTPERRIVPSRALLRHFRHHPLVWLTLCALLLVTVTSIVVYGVMEVAASKAVATDHRAQTTRALPADLFIQSVVKDDGSLGWHQLCPALQAEVPQNVLVQQANAQRDIAARQGLQLTADFVGAHPRLTGGEIRIYVITAHWPSGSAQQRIYSVMTQANGCIEDVKSS